MNNEDPLVALVGGAKSDAREVKARLEESGRLVVHVLPLRATVEDYADLAANGLVGAVVIGRVRARRTEGGYNSIDLADYLRALNDRLPLFYLADDEDTSAVNGAAAFDAIFYLDQVRREAEAHVSRLLRAIGRYGAALSARQARLRELLDRQQDTLLGSGLEESEQAELEELRRQIERPLEARVAKYVERQNEALIEQKSMVAQLEALASQLGKASRSEP